MPNPNDCWGIEIGANALKAIRLQRVGDDAKLVEFDIIPYKKVLTTPEIDADDTIRVALTEFLAKHNIDKTTVVASVPGHMAFARFAKLPPVEPKKIPDIVRFEAVQQIPFPIEEVEWDYQTFQQSDSPDVEVGIFAITKERVARWLGNIHSVGMPIHALALSPVAVYNAMSYDLGLTSDSDGMIFMDVGTSATDLIVTDAGRIWLRTIPIGGHHFTEALLRSFKLSYSKVEKLKREATSSKYARQIVNTMRPVFVDLVNEVQKSLGYYQTLNRDVEFQKMYLMGSTSHLPGLRKLLEQQIGISVERLESFQKIKLPEQAAEDLVTMAPAYGLAIQGLELEQVGCNILPSSILKQQFMSAKVPWNMTAAAIALVAAGLGYTRVMIDSSAFDGNLPIHQSNLAILNTADGYRKELNEIQRSDPRAQIENMQRTMDYRRLWPMILRDIDQARASLQTQPALLSGDLDAIKKIERHQRREMTIESIQFAYTGARAADPPGIRPGTGAPPARPGASAAGAPAAEESTSGTLTITVSGTTPFNHAGKSAASFLTETFIQTLESIGQSLTDAEKRDRPYLISDVVLKTEQYRPPTDSGSRPGTQPRPGTTRPTAPAPTPVRPGTTPTVRPGTTPRPPAAGQQPTVSIYEFFPKDVLGAEDRSKDNRFTIEWKVKVLPPQPARKAAHNAVQQLQAERETRGSSPLTQAETRP